MSKTTEQIYNWSLPPSRENDLSAKTYQMIKKKLEEKFGNYVDIFLQGSYANSTNIKKDSDIDIVVCYKNTYFYNIDFLSQYDRDLFEKTTTNSTYNFREFKSEVEEYLKSQFWSKVERKNKCIRVGKLNNNYVDADVVPCFVHKRFKTYNVTYAEGIEFIADDGENIISFPKQHKENGETKNKETNGKYKGFVRVIKNCKKELVDNGIIDEKFISSFLIECLVYNLDNRIFVKDNTKECLNEIISKIYEDMGIYSKYNDYVEVCELFYLLRGGRVKSTPQEIKTFLEKVYNLVNN